jgi:hypothetical protein
MEKTDTRLIFVYDSCGTLVNGKPFVGFNNAIKVIIPNESDDEYDLGIIDSIKWNCRPNGDAIHGYYFRTRPTTVFKSKVKFYSLKLKV